MPAQCNACRISCAGAHRETVLPTPSWRSAVGLFWWPGGGIGSCGLIRWMAWQ